MTNKKINKLKKDYNKALKLLNMACEWADKMGANEEDSPTMYYVMKEAEKLN